ncbi:hypothetical protein LHL20_18720 [Alteromonas sp. McT4-15]|uniref:hypothetical protein n=1 Tax=Alteromonas sp. McT4-15 TaxID=2881256 RepID=UPI001CF886BD|nr:hypothetical protein [Alteromonas sp. McT4-15]MCB4438269.1 hypothetical protein [Alteromonas sp. McT4-15]
MSNVVFFVPKSKVDAERNLIDFIEHCKNNLVLYEDQGGFKSNTWHYDCGRRKHAMVFSKYVKKQDPYNFEPLSQPFIEFAKAYVRYRQSEKQVTSVGDKLAVLRTVHDALIDIYGVADILKIDGVVQDEVRHLFDARYPGSAKLFRFGGHAVQLYEFLVEKAIAPDLPEWINPWKRPKSKAEGTDKASREWQDERCPSQHQMLALADCFAKAESKRERYWSSVISLLMFAPGRGMELRYLTIHSLHEEDGRLGVRWYAQKGYDYTVKWVPEVMEDTVREAFARLLEISKPARDAAKFSYDNPGVFLQHEGCITPPEFASDRPLNAIQFAHAMNFAPATIQRLKDKTKKYDSITAWNMLGAHQVKWIQEIRKAGNPTYEQLAQYVTNRYSTDEWPNMPKTGRPVWECLLLIRDYEFHAEFEPKGFSWVLPDINQLNDQLKARPLKNPIPTIFQRFGLKDEDGSEIGLSSHQLRVWLSTNAERAGMDSWKLAQWAGRSRIEDNKNYDLRTKEERQAQANALLELDTRPTALEAVKMNIPVAYVDLGLNKVGVADVTEWGFCVHDFAMSPCTKGGECMTCKEHVCMKGMPKTLERIKLLEEHIESQLKKATEAVDQEVFGADRWASHLAWKLAHIRTQRVRMESEDTPEGALLWIPPEHDPSPVERSLAQNGYKTTAPKNNLVDGHVISGLLGANDA